MTMPNFDAMTVEEVAEWIMNNDTTDLLREARPAIPGKRWVLVDADGTEVLRSTAIRMPVSMRAELVRPCAIGGAVHYRLVCGAASQGVRADDARAARKPADRSGRSAAVAVRR